MGTAMYLLTLKHRESRSQPRELCCDVAEIGNAQDDHGDEGRAQTELFANQVGEPLAGHRAHPRRHFLNHDQRDGSGNQRPQQHVPELRAGLRISEDAARVVIDVGGNESGPEHGEKRQQPVPDEGEIGGPPDQRPRKIVFAAQLSSVLYDPPNLRRPRSSFCYRPAKNKSRPPRHCRLNPHPPLRLHLKSRQRSASHQRHRNPQRERIA